ncbi:hypothetical protein BUN20_03955 [Bacteroides fragilis]|nr:hypothetical protein BUN20_03955 [Bacteroides fragilis]
MFIKQIECILAGKMYILAAKMQILAAKMHILRRKMNLSPKGRSFTEVAGATLSGILGKFLPLLPTSPLFIGFLYSPFKNIASYG